MEARRITRVEGTALPLRGEDVDTDRILPARFLRAVTFEGMEAHVFIDDRAAAAKAGVTHPFDDGRFAGASVLLVNRNFGCGSSREHAPQGLQRWGIGAVVGESFSEIFFGNALMIGLPCLTASSADIEVLMRQVELHPATRLDVDLVAGTCVAGDIRVVASLPPHVRDAFVTGAWDTTGLLLDRYAEVDAVAAKLPYIGGFSA
jgi:3-isopropylmalate/(R)-2-methylmalate dehydratase small subunit